MKRKLGAVVLLGIAWFLIAVFATSVYAENCLDKLGMGLMNAASGWLEVPNQAILTSEEHNAFVGTTYGTAKGVGMGIYRTGVGVYDTTTCVVPPYDKAYIEPACIFGK